MCHIFHLHAAFVKTFDGKLEEKSAKKRKIILTGMIFAWVRRHSSEGGLNQKWSEISGQI
ncbi:Uncharacterized protein dnm_059800 [Desulfonema magnum]|uniref:Uncharacterized protein n=1 Tax=Desulfonema magnum TaxID=45655 RepID=A0A975GQD3_9BACT|nr:Uncharacterized protein dnm_059800 [Desulfonema magnum]